MLNHSYNLYHLKNRVYCSRYFKCIHLERHATQMDKPRETVLRKKMRVSEINARVCGSKKGKLPTLPEDKTQIICSEYSV